MYIYSVCVFDFFTFMSCCPSLIKIYKYSGVWDTVIKASYTEKKLDASHYTHKNDWFGTPVKGEFYWSTGSFSGQGPLNQRKLSSPESESEVSHLHILTGFSNSQTINSLFYC